MNIDSNDTLVLYDFCGTIVDVQTPNEYVRYVKRRLNIKIGFVEYFRIFLNKIGFIKRYNYIFPKIAVNKSLLLYQIRGIEYDVLDTLARDYYYEMVKPHIIPQVLDTMEFHRKNGATLSIISAGYEIYLKYFAQEFSIPIVIASEYEYKNDIFTGRVKGRDNYGKEKLEKVIKYWGKDNLKLYKNIVGYTDSLSDLPLLEICNEKVFINHGNKVEEWMSKEGTKVICY